MTEIITASVLLGSLAGICIILYRKIPRLLEFSSDGKEAKISAVVVSSARNVISSEAVKALSPEKLLQATLANTRTLARKTENQTGEWMKKLQQRSKERKTQFADSYWEQFRKRGKKREG